MFRPLKFRDKIVLLVVLAATALLAVTAVTLITGRHNRNQLSAIETRYVPLLELDRDLKALFAPIPHTLSDAAAAGEEAGLVQADRMRDALDHALEKGGSAIRDNGGDPDALRAELHDYYATAREVSGALATGTEPQRLTAKIDAMKRAQDSFTTHLGSAATPNHDALTAAFAHARQSQQTALVVDISVAAAALLLMAILSTRITRRTLGALQAVARGMERFARGEFDREIDVASRDELGDLAREANQTATHLRDYREQAQEEDWIKTGIGALNTEIAGELEPLELGRKAMAFLAHYLDAEVAVAYLGDEAGVFRVLDTYGTAGPSAALPSFALGETAAGRAAADDEVRVIKDIAPDHLTVRSALINSEPRCVVIVPLCHAERTMGVLELALLHEPPPRALELVQRARRVLGIAFRVAESRQRAQTLLGETQRQAEELARTSRYKSEFLANMSHELRTPLNSIMLLSKILADNEERTLGAKQVEFSRLIHRSGEELLALINEVLDLAKVESGKQVIALEHVPLAPIADYVRAMFGPVALQKQLALEIAVAPGLPDTIRTDRARVEQIVKNLLSNAFKFTEHGSIALRIAPASAPGMIAISVTDTGIGIPADKRAQIFEAFTQAESGTSRKYGGTGLGLAIARQLAMRLGGDLTVDSTVGVGSTFALVLPIAGPSDHEPAPVTGVAPAPQPTTHALPLVDDRERIAPGKSTILIIEDDRTFAAAVLALVREEGCAGIVAADGRSGIANAARYKPSGIVLDVGLPDLDGWSVMEALRGDPLLAPIPVHFITAAEDEARARRLGAVGFTSKPVDAAQIRSALHALNAAARAGVRRVLLVEPDAPRQAALSSLLHGNQLEVDAVPAPREALARLAVGAYGCVVMRVDLPGSGDGLGLIAKIRDDSRGSATPIVVYGGRPFEPDERAQLERARDVTLVVGDDSNNRILEETRQFVHRVIAVPAPPPPAPVPARAETSIAGKTVLLADDDMRNVYSLSNALSAKHLKVITAADGQEALEELAAHPEVDIVLMDIAMPRLDGHEAMRRIRAQPAHAKLPMIALTAKTMPGDREKCIEAGANDYMPKPIDIDRLVALMRVWLS